ncbi:MAG: LptF/LptG family permease [Firmicutes bacterium]|nr:LptF/LptG family permease [Bacillota bacterium]
MRKLDRYIFKETLIPLLFGLTAFTSLFLGADLVNFSKMIVRYGAPWEVLVELLLLKCPEFLVWTFPMATLMATLLSLSKLSGTSELVAMRAGGVSYYRLIMPVLVLALMVSGVTIAINEFLVPAADQRYKQVLYERVYRKSLPKVTTNIMLDDYSGGRLSRIIYAVKYDSSTKTMYDVSIIQFENGRPVQQTTADKLVWEKDHWYLEDGTIYVLNDNDWGAVAKMSFKGGRQELPLDYQPEDIPKLKKSPEKMTISELKTQILAYESNPEKSREYRLHYHLKFSVPFASLVFAFVGAPLGIQSHRSARSIGFGLSIVIIFIYYILLTMGSAMVQGGYIDPIIGAWWQDVALLMAGLFLIWRARK